MDFAFVSAKQAFDARAEWRRNIPRVNEFECICTPGRYIVTKKRGRHDVDYWDEEHPDADEVEMCEAFSEIEAKALVKRMRGEHDQEMIEISQESFFCLAEEVYRVNKVTVVVDDEKLVTLVRTVEATNVYPVVEAPAEYRKLFDCFFEVCAKAFGEAKFVLEDADTDADADADTDADADADTDADKSARATWTLSRFETNRAKKRISFLEFLSAFNVEGNNYPGWIKEGLEMVRDRFLHRKTFLHEVC